MTNATNFESLAIPPTSPLLAVLLAYDDSPFVQNAFQALLGRPPDPEASAFYLKRIQSGTTKLQVLTEISGSSEAATYLESMRELRTAEAIAVDAGLSMDEVLAHHDQAFLSCAYKTILGRYPGADELERDLSKLRNGADKIQLLAEIRRSDESTAKAKLLEQLATATRKHERTQMPFMGWIFKRLQRDHVSFAFDTKDGARGSSDNATPHAESNVAGAIASGGNPQFVRHIYVTLLGREPDPQGFEFYMARLESGTQRAQLITELIQSEECTRRQAMIEALDSAIRHYQMAQDSSHKLSKPLGVTRIARAVSSWPVLGRIVNVATALVKLSRLNYQQQFLAHDDLPRLVQRHLDFDRRHNSAAADEIPYLIRTYLDLAHRNDLIEKLQVPQLLAAIGVLNSQQHAMAAEELPRLLQALSDLKEQQHLLESVHMPTLFESLSALKQRQLASDNAENNLIKSVPVALRKMTRDVNVLMDRSRNASSQGDGKLRLSEKNSN